MLGKGLEALIPVTTGSQHADEPLLSAPLAEPVLQTGAQHADLGSSPLMLHVFDDEPALTQQVVAPPVRVEPVQHEEREPQPQRPAPVAAPIPPIEPPRSSEAIFQIEVDKIIPNPDQPRHQFDEGALRDLAASIREFGILQPLVVTKIEREVPTGTEVWYELIAGERRLRASKLIGLERVPAIVRRAGPDRERLELAIIENLQREGLNPVEMARAYARLQDEFRMTQREIASRLGKSREVVANTMRILDLPRDVQDAIQQGKISESHGRLLLSVGDPALQTKLFNDLLSRQMTTRELRERVGLAGDAHTQRGRRPYGARTAAVDEPLSPALQALQAKLATELGAPVKIRATGESGQITISFYSKEELDAILQRLIDEAEW